MTMVSIDVVYEGQLHCLATHGPSGVELTTDAPVDNQGQGASFSPTDLVATALGTCMLTTMAIRTREQGYALQGTRLTVKKHMTPTLPRRIAKLDVTIVVPDAGALGAADRELLESIAHTCPVRLSILDAIEVPVAFHWQESNVRSQI
jgi:putative redox protein